MGKKSKKKLAENFQEMLPGEEPMLSEIDKKYSNRFILSSAVSRRAKQLKDGFKPLVAVEEGDEMFIRTALKEFQSGKIEIDFSQKVEVEKDTFEELDQILDAEIDSKSEDESDSKTKEKKPKSKSLAA